MAKTGRPKGSGRPKTYLQRLRLTWLRAMAQARFLNYELVTWQDWQDLWTEALFGQRGRAQDQLCICKRDFTQPYSRTNICLATRKHSQIALRKFQTYGKPKGISPKYIIKVIND